MNYASILEQIHRDMRPYLGIGVKEPITFRNWLKSPPRASAWQSSRRRAKYSAPAEADTRFSIQSISKLFACTMAFRLLGDALWQRVGHEPSGNAFNSLV